MNNEINRSPVAFLLDDVKNALDYITSKLSETRQIAIINSKITIALDYKPIKMQTPEVDLEKRKITINETYLSYLWCCCYGMIGLNDILYKKAELNKSVVTFNDEPNYHDITEILSWGRSLKDKYNIWPPNIPNPMQESAHVLNANSLLVSTVAYQLFHELGHLVLHSNLIGFIRQMRSLFYEKTDNDIKRMRNIERQADDYAFDCFMSTNDSEDEAFIKYLGAIVANLSNFYLLEVADTRGYTHPDLDERLKTIIKKIKLKEEAHQIHLDAMCTIGMQLFMAFTYTPFLPDNIEDVEFKTFEDIQKHLFNIIEKMKNNANDLRSNLGITAN